MTTCEKALCNNYFSKPSYPSSFLLPHTRLHRYGPSLSLLYRFEVFPRHLLEMLPHSEWQ